MIAHLAFLLVVQGQPQQPVEVKLSTVLNELHDPTRALDSAQRFVELARSSPDGLDESERLLALALKAESDDFAYRVEVRISGELGLFRLAGLIAKRLDTDTRDREHRIGGFSVQVGSEYDPAVATLVSFGQRAVKALEDELESGNVGGRRRSASALIAIGGSSAVQALRSHYASEKDPAVKQFIGYASGLSNGR